MKKLAVISGKGGTGKTMVAGALASLAECSIAFADCDVDAANLELLLNPTVELTKPYYGLKVAEIDQDACTLCGLCEELCRFDAITFEDGRFSVNPIKCEGCAVCTLLCPSDAVVMKTRINGEIYYSKTSFGPFAHARLEPGSGTTGLLVTEVKKLIYEKAGDKELLLIDGPPGIGCPLIATVTGVDAVLIVTEPSISGLHDLKRVVTVCNKFGVDIFVVINKFDLEETVSLKIEDYCQEAGISLAGKIPFDKKVIEAIKNREPVVSQKCPSADAIKEIWIFLKKEFNLL
ncbi:MAG: ATP-binding protein [Methanogenium sp.]|nr:ATP-binding protein [Methanogenium sp.]